jgi:TorA maturation chaperone TorD
MTMTVTHAHDIRTLAHADLLMVLSGVLRHPLPSCSPAQLDELFVAAALPALEPAMRGLCQSAGDAEPMAWSVEHNRLFEGAMACPPNQTAYNRRDKGVVLSDLCGFYNAFGLTAERSTGEKPDHVVTELEFLAMLLVMAARGDNGDGREIAANAARAFADDHLAPWLALFTAQLRLAAPLAVHQALADAVEQVYLALADHYGWSPLQPADGDLPQADLEPPTDECGDLRDPVVQLNVRKAGQRG